MRSSHDTNPVANAKTKTVNLDCIFYHRLFLNLQHNPFLYNWLTFIFVLIICDLLHFILSYTLESGPENLPVIVGGQSLDPVSPLCEKKKNLQRRSLEDKSQTKPSQYTQPIN